MDPLSGTPISFMSIHNPDTFGAWLKTARRTRDLTQKELARRAGCAEITIRKIEANELRPSRRLSAALLCELGIPDAEQATFIELARKFPFH